jgi:hypothetical protein
MEVRDRHLERRVVFAVKETEENGERLVRQEIFTDINPSSNSREATFKAPPDGQRKTACDMQT